MEGVKQKATLMISQFKKKCGQSGTWNANARDVDRSCLTPALFFPLVRDTTAFLKSMEKTTKVEAHLLAIGFGTISILAMYLFVGMSFICDIVGFVPPTIMSFKAIEARDFVSTKHLLTYWVVFVFLGLTEIFAAFVIYWFPYYFSVKLIFLVYAFHPETKGSEKVYSTLIQPWLKKHESQINDAVNVVKDNVRKVSGVVDTLQKDVLAAGDNTEESHDKDL